jgi:putative endonuclease
MARSSRIPAAAWTDARHRLGLAGEEAAMRHLTGAGWSVEAHRFRLGRHELDLVIRRGNQVAFVEVKTRRGQDYGAGRQAIGWRKRQALGRVAEAWRLRHGQPEDAYRFDVIEVTPRPGRTPAIQHLEDAWRLLR